MTKEEFKQSCNEYCNEQLGFECFDEQDSYDVEEMFEEYFPKKITPQAFVHFAFEEDFASKEYDEHLQQEAEEHQQWCDEEE